MSSGPCKRAKPAASPQGYRRLLEWAALPVTDRRWAAPLSAVALGFGLFVGVAIGPGAAGTFATGAAQIIEIPGFSGGADSGEDEGGSPSVSAAAGEGGGGRSPAPESESAFSPLAPLASSEGEAEPTEVTGPPTQNEPPASTEEPKAEEAETLTGIVLHVNPAAASYTIAEPAGTLDVVHAAKPPQPGTKLSVSIRLLANGTFAEAGARTKSGVRTRTTFSGIVTYVDPTPTAPAYTVSKRGVSVLVHVHPDPSGVTPSLPALGAFASVAVDIEKIPPPASASASAAGVETGSDSGQRGDESPVPAEPAPPATPAESPPATPPVAEPAPAPPPPVAEPVPGPTQPSCAPDPALPPPPTIQPSAILWQRQVKAQGAPFTYSDFTGIIEAVCPSSGQLLLSADDIRESGHDLVFSASPEFDLSKLELGQSVLASADIAADGALALKGLASDERTKGAEDTKAAQGDLVTEEEKTKSDR